MPVEVLIGHVFGIQANSPLANSTDVSKILFVARYATRMFVCQDVPLAGQALIARDADKMLGMEILSKCLSTSNV